MREVYRLFAESRQMKPGDLMESGPWHRTRIAGVQFGAALLALAGNRGRGGLAHRGTWLTPPLRMTIRACVEGHCGYISKVVITDESAPVRQRGRQCPGHTDYNNGTRRCGTGRSRVQILTLQEAGDPWHYEGEIYNPEDGNTYTAIEVLADTLKLKGCAMMILCQEQLWQRVP